MCKENQNNDIYSKLIKFVSCNLEGQGLTDVTSPSLDLDNCYFNEIEVENLSTRPFGEEIKLMCLTFVDRAFLFCFWTGNPDLDFPKKRTLRSDQKSRSQVFFVKKRKDVQKRGYFSLLMNSIDGTLGKNLTQLLTMLQVC